MCICDREKMNNLTPSPKWFISLLLYGILTVSVSLAFCVVCTTIKTVLAIEYRFAQRCFYLLNLICICQFYLEIG